MAAELSVDDRVAIHELAARYGNVIDAGDWPGLSRVFSTDATFEIAGFGAIDKRTEGLAAIQTMLKDSEVHPVSHHVTNVEVWADHDGVHLFFKVIGPGPKGRVGSAEYRDIVRKDADGWRIVTHVAALRTVPATPATPVS
jgi:ketosteroid isomerase-like protein